MRDATGGLIGRDGDIRAVLATLSHSRLVTLTGPGGVGKTRLAKEIAAELETEFERVVFIDLTVEGSPLDNALLQDVGALDLSTTLLLVDNCEHVIEDAAATVHELLRVSKTTSVLATSRRPLHVAGEYLHPVRPLSVPQLGEPISDLLTYESIQLFVERSTQLDPTFELVDENAETVAQICRLSDGLPIAIELAAGMGRSRSVAAIADAMKGSESRNLQVKRRDIHLHQQSLARSVGWSLDLLDPEALVLLRCAAVFQGSFAADSLDVIHRSQAGVGTAALMDLLVEHSLATFNPEIERYSLLDVVANAVRASTDAETATSLLAAHTTWAIDRSTRIAENATKPDPDRSFPRFQYDLPDLAWSADRLAQEGETDRWLDLVGPIADWWVHHAGNVDVDTWEAELVGELANDTRRIALANGLAFHLSHLGDHEASLKLAERSAAAAAKHDRGDLAIPALIAIGNAQQTLGRAEDAAVAFGDACDIELDPPNAYLRSIARLCLARTTTGESRRIELAACLEVAGADHPAVKLMAEQELARCALEENNLVDAQQWAEQGIRTAAHIGFREAEGTARNILGTIAIKESRYEDAEVAHRTAIQIGQRIGHSGLVADGLLGIAMVFSAQASADRAGQVVRLALEVAPTIELSPELRDASKTPTEPLRLQDLPALWATMAAECAAPKDHADRPTLLTERETSVLLLLRGDLTQREIADELYVSPSTVRTHVKSIYRKLGVHNRTSCVHHATVLGLLPAP